MNDRRALLPHGVPLQLIDTVLSVDAERLHCSSARHLHPNHPLAAVLRRGQLSGRGEPSTLPACHVVEYAAQACGLHIALNARAALPAVASADDMLSAPMRGEQTARAVLPPIAPQGRLVLLREVAWYITDLLEITVPLHIRVTRQGQLWRSSSYGFRCSAGAEDGAQCVAEGSLAVAILPGQVDSPQSP